jgi:hypothetical protein
MFNRSVKHLSKHGGCSINFNDFTLDKGATNPNWLAPSTRRKADSLTLDEQYEKGRNARIKKKESTKPKTTKTKRFKKSRKSSKSKGKNTKSPIKSE